VKARILGTGSYLPEHVLTNDDMAKLVDTNDEWIRERTGIRERHLTDQGTLHMACEASKRALQNSGLAAEDLDMIIVATFTPDYLFPNASCQLQAALGVPNIPCMDLSAACSGFVYSINTAAAYIQAGIYSKILVVASETLSRVVDWNDRSTCILFGDGAGAAVIGADETGILAMDMGSDGVKGSVLYCEGWPITNPVVNKGEAGKLRMDGQEVYKFAVRRLPRTIQTVADAAGIAVEEVDHFIFHQANRRILQAAAKHLKIPEEKVPMNMDHCGNLSAASIPVLLDEYYQAGKIKRGDKVVLAAFGGGLSWASALLEW
jgi:3-oxoacyl-[acyl-carrier-protein] synthase-3